MNNQFLDILFSFLDSNFFIGIVTLLVGLVAFRIYKKQKLDAKRDAANVILLEIQSAEQQLQIVNQNPDTLSETLLLMKNSSWDKYRYLFVRDFDRNEWDKVSDFYNKCILYDRSALSYSSTWADNVKSAQSEVLRVLAEFAKDYTTLSESVKDPEDLSKLRAEFEQRKGYFISAYGVVQNTDNYEPPYFYNPQRPVLEAKAILNTIETNISITSIGNKLKSMAGEKNYSLSLADRIFKR